MSSSQHSTTWTGALSEATNPIDERKFKDSFYKLCHKHGEYRAEQLLNRLLDVHCGNTIALADNVDDALESETDTVSGVFFSSLLKVVEVGLEANIPLQTILSYFEGHDLDDPPDLDDDTLLFLRQPEVRAPLQSIFNEIIECHTMMILHFQEHGPSSVHNFEPIMNRYDEASSRIEGYRKEWTGKLEAAQKKEADKKKEEADRIRRESMSGSLASVQNGLNGQPISPRGGNLLFDYERHLGHGRHAVVSAMRMAVSGELFAQKMIQYESAAQFKQMEKEVRKEVEAMQLLHHHHIPRILFCLPDQQQYTFSIYMSPVGDSDLGQFLPSFTKENDIWFGCLIAALHHAHSREIIHQDIKPSNIIIKNNQPYLADFGSARDFSTENSSLANDDIIRGTPNYLAPEYQPGKSRGRKADVFSLGCVFAEMLTVRQGRKREEFDARRYRSNVDFPYAFRHSLTEVEDWLDGLECPQGIAESLRETVYDMLKVKTDRRSSTRTLLRDLRAINMVCKHCREPE